MEEELVSLSSYFQYNKDARHIMYTTNFIGSFPVSYELVPNRRRLPIGRRPYETIILVRDNIYAKWNKPMHS